MTFNNLNKEQKMLVYMLKLGASHKAYPLQVWKYGDEVISFGITSNINSMKSMFHRLKAKGLMIGLGEGCWYLSEKGHDEARKLAMKCNLIGPYCIEDQLKINKV